MTALPHAIPQRDPGSRVDTLKSVIEREIAQLRTELEHTPSTPDDHAGPEGRVGRLYQAFLRHSGAPSTHALHEEAA